MLKNILIVKLSAIGDVIHALPVASAIKKCYPEVRITWIVEKPAYSILADNPNIDELLVFDKTKFKTVSGLIKNSMELSKLLKERKFDLTLDLQGLFKSAAIAWLSGADKRLVYCNAREMSHVISERICGSHSDGHIVDRYLDVARYIGCQNEQAEFSIHFSDEDVKKSAAIAKHAGLDLDQKFIVIAPGTNWATKCWPTSHFAKLADLIYGQKFIPVVIGAPNDERLFEEIAAQSAIPPINLTGKTTLKQLAYIIKQAQMFVGGDTGPMHLAVAVNTKTIALFGPTDPARNGPYGTNNKVITTPASCAGCWKRSCDKNCMEMIHPSDVFQAVQSLMP